jgi:hypothetical protein
MTRWLGLTGILLLTAIPAPVSAQLVEVSPLYGYRVGGDFFERVTGQPVDLDGSSVIGGVLNVALRDGLWVEGLFSHQDARIDVPAAGLTPPTRWRVAVDHWMVGGLQEFGYGRASPFLTGLLGLTRYGAEGDNEIRFAVSAGGGVKLRPSRHVGLRLDGRVFVTFADIDGRAIACSPGFCLLAVQTDAVWQGEVSAGLVIAF